MCLFSDESSQMTLKCGTQKEWHMVRAIGGDVIYAYVLQ